MKFPSNNSWKCVFWFSIWLFGRYKEFHSVADEQHSVWPNTSYIIFANFEREALPHSTQHFFNILSYRVRRIVLLFMDLLKSVVAKRFSVRLTHLKCFGSSVSYVASSWSCLLARISTNSKKIYSLHSELFGFPILFPNFTKALTKFESVTVVIIFLESKLNFRWISEVSAIMSYDYFPIKPWDIGVADSLLKPSSASSMKYWRNYDAWLTICQQLCTRLLHKQFYI